jgi:hypothetical protein
MKTKQPESGKNLHQVRHYSNLLVVFVAIFSLLATFPGCRSLPPPELLPIDPPGTREESEEAYNSFKLTTEGDFFGYRVFQGEETELKFHRQIQPLFLDSSGNAYHLFDKSRRRNNSGISLASIGGFVIGLTLSYSAVDPYPVQGSKTDYYILGAGAVMMITGLIISGTQYKPMVEAVNEYNLDLSSRWDLD